MCRATPASRATLVTPCMVASGHTVPKPPLDVFSIDTRRERGALRLLGSRSAALTCSPVNTPLGPSIGRIMTPELAAGPPVSALMMWAVRSAITSSPRRQCTRMAIWLAIVPLGRKSEVFLAQKLADALAQPVDRGVLHLLLVAHFGVGHGLSHAGRGLGLGVAVEIDETVLHGVSGSPAPP